MRAGALFAAEDSSGDGEAPLITARWKKWEFARHRLLDQHTFEHHLRAPTFLGHFLFTALTEKAIKNIPSPFSHVKRLTSAVFGFKPVKKNLHKVKLIITYSSNGARKAIKSNEAEKS